MYRLIIVDDEKAAREAISASLNWADMGIEVVGLCRNGQEAYNMLLDDSPDIVLTDIRMPVMSGLDLISKTAQSQLNIEFVILSGYGEFELAKEAMRWGVKHYLLKPCNSKQIEDVMRCVLQDIKNRRMAESTERTVLKAILAYLESDHANRRHTIQEEPRYREIESMIRRIRDIQTLKMILITLLFHQGQSNKAGLISRIMTIVSDKSNRIGVNTLHEQILDEFNVLISQKKPTSYTDYVEMVIRYVDENLDDPQLTLRSLAENYLYMSPDYLSHQFLKQTGEKFSTYLTRKRVEKAQMLLMQNDNVKIYEVARAVGRGDYPQYFSQIFKNITGVTPSEFIKSQGGGIKQQ